MLSLGFEFPELACYWFQVNVPAPMKAHAAPHFGLPFFPKLQEKTQVDVCPFSFEDRERERRLMKEKRLEELRHEEVGLGVSGI